MPNQTSEHEQFIKLVYLSIEDNLGNKDFTVEYLAEKMGLSKSLLQRKILRITGKSASEIILEKRLFIARELLINNAATVSEIAYKVGFNNPSYFNSVFKKYYKISPGEIKRKNEKSCIVNSNKTGNSQFSKFPFVFVSVILFISTIVFIYFLFLNKKTGVDKSIAILPFENLSSLEEDKFLADGIVEDLLYRLSNIQGLKVISRTSSEICRNQNKLTVPEIAKILNVSYILEGSIQREGNNVRIYVQLINAKTDDHILSKQYNRDLNKIFNFQSEIANEITSELSLALTDSEVEFINKNQTKNLKSFEALHIGRHHLNTRTKEGIDNSIKYFRIAIKNDPKFAMAYAGLADAYFNLSWYMYIDRKIARDSAIYFASKALKIDNKLGEARTILGAIYHEYDLNYNKAEKEFKKALETNPNHSTTYQYYSELLSSLGKYNEARIVLNKAIQLDPYSFIIRVASAELYLKEGDLNNALSENKICLELINDQPTAVFHSFIINFYLKNETIAFNDLKKTYKIYYNCKEEFVDSIYRKEGIKGLLWWELNEEKIEYDDDKAINFALLGENEKAIEMLELSYKKGMLLPFHTAMGVYRNLHQHPKFIALRKKMGLPLL